MRDRMIIERSELNMQIKNVFFRNKTLTQKVDIFKCTYTHIHTQTHTSKHDENCLF